MSENEILIYATNWCGDCRRARRFFESRQIPFKWIDIDRDREAEQFVRETNNGNRSVPTIIFPDGTIMVEPSSSELAAKYTESRE
jgi:mycoredoxin